MTLQLKPESIQSIEHTNNLSAARGNLALQLKHGSVIEVFPSEVIEPIRYMVTQGMYRDNFTQCISIISAMGGEGVTYTSRALATTLAHDTRQSVCWVDLNWWSPDLMSQQLLSKYSGITDVLYRKAPLEDALIQTTNPFLSLMIAGQVDPQQRPVLSRGKYLGALLKTLKERFDYILLDVPSIKSSSDAIALASLGDSCCVVVQQGMTSSKVVGDVLSEIDHVPVMGVLMNRVQYKTPMWIRNFIASN